MTKLILHIINVTVLIRTESLIGTDVFFNWNTFVRISDGVLQ